MEPFKPTLWVMEGCPYSFRVLLFLAEARLLDKVKVEYCDPDDPSFDDVEAGLAEATGKHATFPTAEIEPGRFLSDSQQLVDHFADEHHVRAQQLPAFTFYQRSIFPQLDALHSNGMH